jgi:hypothetical protein
VQHVGRLWRQLSSVCSEHELSFHEHLPAQRPEWHLPCALLRHVAFKLASDTLRWNVLCHGLQWIASVAAIAPCVLVTPAVMERWAVTLRLMLRSRGSIVVFRWQSNICLAECATDNDCMLPVRVSVAFCCIVVIDFHVRRRVQCPVCSGDAYCHGPANICLAECGSDSDCTDPVRNRFGSLSVAWLSSCLCCPSLVSSMRW